MGKNHENWKSNWIIDANKGLAYHKTGIVAELKQKEVVLENSISVRKINKKLLNFININNLQKEAEILLLNK